MIRDGDIDDIPGIVHMAKEFWQHTQFDEPFCEETVSMMCHKCIQDGLMCVLEIDGINGFACGVKGALLANAKIATGCEVAWWVDESYRRNGNGIALLEALERAAKVAGIKYWTMVYMESCMPETIEKIYESMGYNKSETSYVKVL